jgi:hypothetical protein
MMIGLIWNCQGLGNSSKAQFLKELIRDEKVDFIGLQGFNTNVFDVRENEIGEFMIRTLIFHKEKNLIWNFVNVYGAAQKENKCRFLCELFVLLLEKSCSFACWR